MKVAKLYQKVGDNLVDLDSKYATQQDLKNGYQKKLTSNKTFYVGGENASDTLDEGRGESPDKPFANLLSCMNYISQNFIGVGKTYITIYLQENITTSLNYNIPNLRFSQVILSCDPENRKTLKLTGSTYLDHSLNFANLIIDMDQGMRLDDWLTPVFVYIYGNTKIIGRGDASGNAILNAEHPYCRIWLSHNAWGTTKKDIELESVNGQPFFKVMTGGYLGSASNSIKLSAGANISQAVCIADSGIVNLPYSSVKFTDISGITGKRYDCKNGGKIFTNGRGENFIPGTINGTCDALSLYI